MGDVGIDLDHQSNGGGLRTDGINGRTDGTTSAARCDSKRIEMDALAGCQMDQHKQRQRTGRNVHEPSKPHPTYHILTREGIGAVPGCETQRRGH